MLQRLGGPRAIKHWNDARGNLSVELCAPSMACDREEVGSDSSRKMQDKEETTSKWRLELEGEAERLEATVPWNEAEGFSVNPEGEGRQVRAQITRKERRTSTKDGRKGRWRGTW